MIDTQAIRSKILDLAMRGQLTKQLPEDGTGEELFQKIQAEKQALIKAGKIKKQKPLPEISDEDLLYEIRKNWKVCRFGSIITLVSGTDYKPEEYNDQKRGTPYITGASNLLLEGVLINRWTETPRCIANEGDVLLVCKGSGYGKVAMCDVKKAHIARQIMAIKKTDFLDMKYILYFLSANFAYLKGKGQGLIPGVDRNSVLNMIFPLPPLAEQQRIVEKINQAFSVLDMIDTLQLQYADNLTALKAKLIDAAIQGKLTEQLPEDGTAEELYREVQAERKCQEEAGTIKAVELTPEMDESEKTFDIPSNWKWTNLGNVSYIVRGGSPRPIKQYITTREDGINWIKIGDVEKGGKYIYSTHEKIIPEGESKSRHVYPGDFLLTNSMSFGRPYISKIEGCIHDGWLLIHSLNGFDPDYLYYLLSSTYLYGQFTVKASGSTVDNLNIDKVKNAIIPLPPLAEQKRIAQKIDELMPLFEK